MKRCRYSTEVCSFFFLICFPQTASCRRIVYLCRLLQFPQLWLSELCDPFRHPSPCTEYTDNSSRLWSGDLLTDTLWCWWPSFLCTGYFTPEWLWRRHKAMITGVIEIFSHSNWEGLSISVFIVYASMFYFWKLTSSSLRKKKLYPTLMNNYI